MLATLVKNGRISCLCFWWDLLVVVGGGMLGARAPARTHSLGHSRTLSLLGRLPIPLVKGVLCLK